jgi:hypothetical protein
MRFFFSLVAMTALVGCSDVMGPDSLDDDLGARIVEGSPEALGMLDLVNHESTTEATLDDDVGLDRRAARSIIAHRNGPDRVFGTADDDLFDSITELDDQYYVGRSALADLSDWAFDHNWVATNPNDVLGTWDGVTFTLGEATATVELANTAGPNYLDHDLGLDSRAVKSIKEARTIQTVEQMAGLYYVGKSALTKLKNAAGTSAGCDIEGWDTEYIYADDSGEWRSKVPAELSELIDDVVQRDDWCGEAFGEAWFVKATVDRFNCEQKGYTVELGQLMDQNHGVSWYIEFEVDAEFSYNYAVCEV